MTALNWVLQEDQVTVACDTLVSSATDMLPVRFISKVFPIHHARTLLAGTGSELALMRALSVVISGALCRHVVDVDRALTAVLPGVVQELPESITSTIYIFGWDEDQRQMRGHAYRSPNGFASELLRYGLGIKPQVDVSTGSIEPFEPFFIDIVMRQREEDEQKPLAKRVGIGGEIILFQMTEDELTAKTIHRFADYPHQFNLAANRPAPSLSAV
ncbi:hypothetical protein JMJ56_22440 [Belnapia sp. T18]|uniref:Uncharacterized protein n=1 Tax=Belnapia arida TaxID=2804533 RepID=A0ABS1U7Z1_9PROT|nr:hypothetical protein [Belnapia arida]MBL6080779.1 hypothetical protein [Belnapia arida]